MEASVSNEPLVVGIDLGTTHSLIAMWAPGGPKIIPNALGEALTPSVVSIDDDGTVLIGEAARERLITHADRTIADFKRRMGSKAPITLAGKDFRPEELSALVLRRLKEDAENHTGRLISEAVISVPAYFNDTQRKATLAAGKLAGIKVERLVNEPTAAALAYGLGEAGDRQILVFDLGGGTFDVSFLDKFHNVMEVRASAGDNYLGGNDFRDLIADWLARQGHLELAALSPSDRNALMREAERVKRRLTEAQEASFKLVVAGTTIEGVLSRQDFERVAASLLRRLRQPIEQAINDAAVDLSTVDSVILAGGATRMPCVRKLVATLLGRLPLSHLDPDQIVGLGAGALAGLKSRQIELEDVVMTDVCPYTLGIAVREGLEVFGGRPSLVMAPIIERNTIVPVSHSDIFSTVSDQQKQVDIEVYQGENRRPEHNVHLGSLHVPVPADKAGAQGIDIRFTYDINGVLEVEATVLSTRNTKRRIFHNDDNLSEAEIDARLAALGELKLHPWDQAENRLLLARAERLYAEALGERRQAIANLITSFRAAIASRSLRDPEKVRSELRQSLDAIDAQRFQF